ncbi:MAG: phosphate ABC transporter substrate-binding protein PstS [Endozoicomonas sp. (ex Botrylloides leachii)]|nr:phosphate ABC transporter substrate-binding protein PstS [Endozoicomonas sp. (ex Botrylloides leachii)]
MKIVKSILIACVLSITSLSVSAKVVSINGAGATFPYPVYAKWAEEYHKETGVQINYQAIGSGGGIRQITANTVDFGASDKPLSQEELKKDGMIQFPAVMGAIVPIVNIPNIKAGELKLDGKTLAEIYLGQIKKWNDPRLVKLNPTLKLPDRPIYVVHRSDGSGTTYNFTDYLSRVSPQWKATVGRNTDIAWPQKATTIGGNGNAGVANFVSRTPGTIGYVEYAFAKQNDLAYTQLTSADGHFLKPSMKTFQAAAANADWAHAPDFHLLLNNQPGADSWPMTAATFILLHKKQADPKKAKAIVDFFDWGYKHGAGYATGLDYIPMPASVVKLVENVWKKDLTSDGKTIIK